MKLEDLGFLKIPGSGITTKVYLVKDRVASKRFALKVVKENGPGDGTAFIAGAIREQTAMREIAGGNFLCELEASWHDEVI